ncbi:hypothetical protein A3B21_00675 [Candidatus Uhrbacteria bacterium RIFCSPLOWO2_01_FULL_47_24]|uniref:Clp R domain-containing protein n=1 Tax=Candidatus Uhrbacteria bacterium RIFCSPLOWO2_01_FULL_47_24 TaxID=1802401 RepID=A0A1F7UNM9_9BACT|nr:MAG: hypothetical protein A2753_04845 [Candidatus Uhrbacteria bacterium RIFCSPHIGHO2_01_FULL_47_11]OGL67686.1 MAG: hypothetical protein A3D58_04565 [Candidatus Uhrbacteria bacterium RIFCSPHIGHO2_02_FULL_46_47]OGL74869.1 MAG: hypothetical protein A3F52_00330 [Candidatus Uhrbacteria bacterium RIFCSPHIGHO2_12_FULL_47_11]OGL79891.1 MAG: hypothetical protein A3B21_00675 [Candidatus Uhrbacteria bacterium RIFCSPLOWO2_01_FULL_47_24]OGL84111.1 MAG: hypothetical protein A3J03_03470 [Candidatus Uhrbact
MELYFGAKIDRATLFAQRVARVARAAVAILVAAFGVLGILALVFETWPNVERLLAISYWLLPSKAKFIFGITLLADLYLVARVLRSDEGKEDVRPSPALRTSSPLGRGRGEGKRIDVSRALSQDSERRIKDAYLFTSRLKHAEVRNAHMLAALLGSPAVASLLVRLEVDGKGLQERLKHVLQTPSPDLRPSSPLGRGEGEGQPIFGDPAKQAVIAAYRDAQTARAQTLGTHHIFLETILQNEKLTEILFDLGVDQEKLRNAVRWLEINDKLRARWRKFRGAASRKPTGAMNRAMTALETRRLDRFSDDLTLLAGRGYLELVVNREKEFEAIFRVLQGERKSVLLVGPHGVGKETILNGIAEQMVEEEVPKIIQDRRFVSLSLPKLIAGATTSEAEQRLLTCLNDVGRSGNVVLAIPNVHEASAGRGAGGLDLAEVLAGELSKGYFLAIATTTPEEYRSRIEGTALGNAFVIVEIAETDHSTTIQILESKVGAIEYQTKTFFSYSALEKAVILTDRYIKDHYLPEKAIDIIKEAAQYTRSHRGEKALVRGEDVAEIISQKSHVPVTSVTAKEADKLLHLESIMHERIIGQDEAVKAVAAALRRARAELRTEKRPIANFLFLGPTGVGKTETAKTVAEVYFGNEENMIRLDMSEYQEKSAVYRIIGAPGESGGLLTEPVRKNPFSLVLLDELEKAHPDILNIFLQVLDDGRATDSAGRVIDFTNAIIIATSNAGSPYVQEELKKGTAIEEIKKGLLERELKQYFRPEFLNRFDAVIVYKPLTEEEIVQIARLIIAKIAKQLEAKGITFRATDEAIAELAHAGFDPQFGARPLRRVIQERVQDALANLLLTAKLSRRDVVVLEKGGQLRVEKAEKL